MTVKKSALGRGLGALIEDVSEVKKSELTSEILLENIELNPFQPRMSINEEMLVELSNSIKQLGIIQPVTVREIDDGKYQLITGERRFRASKLAGLSSIPAFVRRANDNEMLELALVENIQREDLDPIEIAISYQRLIDELKFTHEIMSDRVGKDRSTITNYLRLLKLPPEIQLAIKAKRISMSHARSFINLEDAESQLRLCNQIIENDLSVRQTEKMINSIYKKTDHVKAIGKEVISPEIYIKLQDHLTDFFKAKIEFKRNKNGSGKIVIPFKSDEDLERVIGIFDKINS